MSNEVVSFVPGPAHVRREVREALARACAPHRSAEGTALLDRVQRGLRELLSTDQPVFPVLGSATTALEVALRGVGRKRMLALVTGAFSERTASIGRAIGLQVEELRVPFGSAVEPDMVARALRRGGFDTLTLAHCETQTGVLLDLPAIAALVRDHPRVALVVDAVASLGGVEIAFDELGPTTIVVGQTSKALACPPGLSLMAVAPEAAHRASHATQGGFALDLAKLIREARDVRTPQTPGTPLLHALDVQLPAILAEGVAARAARHRQLRDLVLAWAETRFPVLADEGVRSPTVTALEIAPDLPVERWFAAVEARGFRIAPGYGALRGATCRIGHLGDVTREQTEALLSILDDALAAVGRSAN